MKLSATASMERAKIPGPTDKSTQTPPSTGSHAELAAMKTKENTKLTTTTEVLMHAISPTSVDSVDVGVLRRVINSLKHAIQEGHEMADFCSGRGVVVTLLGYELTMRWSCTPSVPCNTISSMFWRMM